MGKTSWNKPSASFGTRSVRAPGLFEGNGLTGVWKTITWPGLTARAAVLVDHDGCSIVARPWQPVRSFCSTETCTVAARQPAVHKTGTRRAGTGARAGVGKPIHGTGGTCQVHLSEHASSVRRGYSGGGMARPGPRKSLHGTGETALNMPSAPFGTRSVRAPGLFEGIGSTGAWKTIIWHGWNGSKQARRTARNMLRPCARAVRRDGRFGQSRRSFCLITTVVLVDHHGRSGRSRRLFCSITMVVLVDHDSRSARSRRSSCLIRTAVILDHDGRSGQS